MDYKINGSLLPYVECNLSKGESISAEAGAMLYMNPKIEYKVQSGGIKKMFGRAFTGESMFLSKFTATEDESKISFSSSFPGEILAVDVTPEKSYIIQKSAYLASEEGVELSAHFQKKLGAGFFGGEGIFNTVVRGPGKVIMQTMTIGELSARIAPYMAYRGR